MELNQLLQLCRLLTNRQTVPPSFLSPSLFPLSPPYFPSIILFSIFPIHGFITRKYPKYNTDAICPIITNGSSTTCPPMYVNIKKSATKNQYAILLIGLNCLLLILLCSIYGNTNNTSNDANNANTPNNLFGIDLNIAYANKK